MATTELDQARLASDVAAHGVRVATHRFERALARTSAALAVYREVVEAEAGTGTEERDRDGSR